MFDLVLAGLDGSPSARRAVTWAAAEAAARRARLGLVSCYEVPWVGRPPVTVERVSEIEEDTETELGAVIAELRATHPGLDVTGDALAGKPRHVLRDAGLRADLVVVGAGSDGSDRHLRTGATARFVARHSAAPVVIVPAEADGHDVARVVVGIDGDAADEPALRWAADDAQRRGAELLVVHADPACGPGARAVVDHAVATARAGRDLEVRFAIAPTDPAPALLEAGCHDALIVVGRRHTTAAGAFALGTCSRALLRRTRVPVVIVDGPR
jgi:nucleotide-binding universal stress UspA family protein